LKHGIDRRQRTNCFALMLQQQQFVSLPAPCMNEKNRRSFHADRRIRPEPRNGGSRSYGASSRRAYLDQGLPKPFWCRRKNTVAKQDFDPFFLYSCPICPLSCPSPSPCPCPNLSSSLPIRILTNG